MNRLSKFVGIHCPIAASDGTKIILIAFEQLALDDSDSRSRSIEITERKNEFCFLKK